MKNILFISGGIVFLCLVLRLIGIFVQFPFNNLLLWVGLIILALLFFPVLIVYTYKEERKINEILRAREIKQKKKNLEKSRLDIDLNDDNTEMSDI